MKQTLTIHLKEAAYDVQIDSEQRIITTLKVLGESIGGLSTLLGDVEILDKRSGRKIDANQTYEEAQIHTGAELLVFATVAN